MTPLTLEGDTLGKKHESYNKLLKDAIANRSYELSKINFDDNDVDNLLKIDIASKTRNVDFIIETLKCDDMLYVSRAIKASRWLITDAQYAHVINPEYLHTRLFPAMNTKAVNKLMLHIRLHLKQHQRVEVFYNYLKDTKDSYKWLEHCSTPFIQNVLKSGRSIPISLFKRLCERDISFLSFHRNVNDRDQYALNGLMLRFLNTHTEAVLDFYNSGGNHWLPSLKRKYTKIIMKKCPQKIIDHFEKYTDVDMAVVAKYMANNDIEHFLKTQMQNKNIQRRLNDYNVLKHFIRYLRKEERFEFIKKTFKEFNDQGGDTGRPSDDYLSCTTNYYHWYSYAPFSVAFPEMKKLIRTESSPTERSRMLSILTTSAQRSPKDIKTLLKFYYEKHINEPFVFKSKFVKKFLSQVNIHDFDSETWNILDQIFHSMEVYTESDNNVQLCLQSIILYKVLNDKNVPEIVEKKFSFDTFIGFRHKLTDVQQEKIFAYLMNSICVMVQNQKCPDPDPHKSEFSDRITLLQNALDLLKDWKKDIKDYPFIIENAQKLHEINSSEHFWDTTIMYFLYNMNKKWPKYVFNILFSLRQDEDMCLNALKHNPQLLVEHNEELDKLRTNNTDYLTRFLSKLRVYFQQSLAQPWIEAYSNNLINATGHKTICSGLFMLLPQKQINDMAIKHAPGPDDIKVNWGETDQAEVSLRKHIALNLHIARPIIPLDTVLLYAKGDYLQFAVPSLSSVLHCFSKDKSRVYLPKLLDAPVSLQKHGLRLAFLKLNPEDLKPIFFNVWNTTKNPTIRAFLFTFTYDSLGKAKNPTMDRKLWQMLSMFVDHLSNEECKEIYTKMGDLSNVPDCVIKEAFVRNFEFLSALPEKLKCQKYVKQLRKKEALNVMHLLEKNFVVNKLLEPEEIRLTNRDDAKLLATFVLCGRSEEDQLNRYRKYLAPALEYVFQEWNRFVDGHYVYKKWFKQLLTSLTWNFRKLISINNIPVSAKLFTEIKTKIEERLQIYENYVLYTSWKLIIEYVNLVNENRYPYFHEFEKENSSFNINDLGYIHGWLPEEAENVWKQVHIKISPIFAATIVKMLKEDLERFPSVCLIFKDAVEKAFDDLSFPRRAFLFETVKHMLDDQSCIDTYIVACNLVQCSYNDIETQAELKKIVLSHPSAEVKMHYYRIFSI